MQLKERDIIVHHKLCGMDLLVLMLSYLELIKVKNQDRNLKRRQTSVLQYNVLFSLSLYLCLFVIFILVTLVFYVVFL